MKENEKTIYQFTLMVFAFGLAPDIATSHREIPFGDVDKVLWAMTLCLFQL